MMTQRLILLALIGVFGSFGATNPGSVPPPTNQAGVAPIALQQFQGRWVVDKKNSPSAEFAPEDLTQEVKVNGDAIVVRSKFQAPKNGIYPIFWAGLTLPELNLPVDGSPSDSMVGPFKYEFKTLRQGNQLYTDYQAAMDNAGNKGWLKGHWVHTLSEDGKWMWLQLDGTCSDGRTIKATLLFKKK
jgi:hypothetical protein